MFVDMAGTSGAGLHSGSMQCLALFTQSCSHRQACRDVTEGPITSYWPFYDATTGGPLCIVIGSRKVVSSHLFSGRSGDHLFSGRLRLSSSLITCSVTSHPYACGMPYA